MSKPSIRNITVDRPSTFDEKGERIFPHPAEVHGFFRKYRNFFYSFLIVFYFVIPWVEIGGTQAVLINIVDRKFAFFGLRFWGHDMPMVFFVLAILTLGLAFITSVWGRVWCGWGCPQTVFIDHLYRRVEAWIEGNHLARIKLDQAPWTFEKIRKRSFKWLVYFVISSAIAHSFIAYFVGADELLAMQQQAPQNNWTVFLFVFVIASLITFDFGWFREQFCLIACPYGRFQSVLMDGNSMAPIYDDKRGEPRKAKDVPTDQQGDCVNCFRCVSVCPTRIDIRRGIQLECIACTACIDACDEVMDKVEKPRGLIRYSTENKNAGQAPPKFHKRTGIYLTLLSIVLSGFAYALSQRQDVDLSFIRAIESPYQVVGEQVINHFKVHGRNQSFERQIVTVKISENLQSQGIELVAPTFPVTVEPGDHLKNHIFIRFPKSLIQGSKSASKKIEVTAEWREFGQKEIKTYNKELPLVGPFQ